MDRPSVPEPHSAVTAPFRDCDCRCKPQGEWVWVDSAAGVAIGARVKVTSSGQRLLVDDEGKVNMGAAQN